MSAPDEPISLDDAKLNLRVSGTAEDSLIADLIVAAREHVEDETGLVLTPRAVTETGPRLGRYIELAAWPISSIDAVRYTAPDGTLTEFDTSAWRAMLNRRPVRIVPATFHWGLPMWSEPSGSWPTHDRADPYWPIEADVTAGFATPDDVPMKIKQAMHLLISHFYINRSAVEAGARAAAVTIPLGVEALLERWTLDRV